MILKFTNYKPNEIKLCYVINVVDIEVTYGRVWFRQVHNSKWVSVAQADMRIKVLSQLDTDEPCHPILEHASLLEIATILELDELLELDAF